MFGRKKEMMVYVIMGFLEAGKTSLITDLLQDELFDDHAKTLILACEEGEEEYEQDLLGKTGAACEYIEEEEDFQGTVIAKFLKKHRPDRIIIEYNGMWPASHIPEIYDELEEICFDREVIFQTIDVVNPRAQIVYESKDDAFYEMKEEMPFDINADIIEVLDDDFGLWYIDMLDHPETYTGKTIKIKGLIQKTKGLGEGFVVFGRFAMTCCADDVQYMGFLCKADDWSAYEDKQYVTVTARLEFKYMKEYAQEGPVFYADAVEAAGKPKEELVYFN